MNEYRSKLKIQNCLFGIGAVVLIAVQVLAYMRMISPIAATQEWADAWNGFIAGVALGVTLLLVVGFVRNQMSLRNEASLKKLFVKENDERTKQVCVKGKSAGATLSLSILLIGGIISGYFNITVSVTCIVCLLILSLCMTAGKLYYSRKL